MCSRIKMEGRKVSGKKQKKPLGLYLLLNTLKQVFKGNKKYIKRVLEFDENSEYVKIQHNGNTDYGKVLYVIKENTGADGFCATLYFIMCYLIFAEQHGFIPVIELTKDFVYYDEEMSVKTENPWNYYFVEEEEFHDKNKALNVCYCDYTHREMIEEKYNFSAYKVENYYDESVIEICSPLISRYMRLKPEITEESWNLLKELREKGSKILGVHFRGTDYKKGYNNHPVFVDEKTTIEEIKKATDVSKFEAVFVATDDDFICDRIREAVKGITVLWFPDVFRSDGTESVAFSNSNRKNHHYLLGYEIARDMYTLSLCDGLVAGKSNVGFLSNLYKRSRNEKYEYMQIIDNGNNSNNNEYFKES